MAEAEAQIAERIGASNKYRWLCPGTIARIVHWAAQRWTRATEIERGARRKLHQVYGAYLRQWDADRAARLVDELVVTEDGEEREVLCRSIASLHASTRERMEIMDEFYPEVLANVQAGARVLDIGCGLNPFCLPRIQRIGEIRYVGWEIDRRVVDSVNRSAVALDMDAHAVLGDVLVDPPIEPFDMVWLFKMLPCLAQQEAGDLGEFLACLPTRRLAVSFPLRSLGGRAKGMRENYSRLMDDLLARQGWVSRTAQWPTELLYVVEKPRP